MFVSVLPLRPNNGPQKRSGAMKGLLQHAGQFAGCLLLGSILVQAQGDQRPVTIQLKGAPDDVQVAFLVAGGQKTLASETGPDEFTLASDLLDPNKRVEVWEVVCDDGTVVAVMEPNAQLPPGCRKRRRLGAFLWGPGKRFAAGDGMWLASGKGITTVSALAGGGLYALLKSRHEDNNVVVPRNDVVVRPALNTTFTGATEKQLNLTPGGACNASWRPTANVRVVVTDNEVLLIHVLPTGEVSFRHFPINRETNRITGSGSVQVGSTNYVSQTEIGIITSGTTPRIDRVSQQITYTNASNQQQCRIGYAE
jgi:hypothetical protein